MGTCCAISIKHDSTLTLYTLNEEWKQQSSHEPETNVTCLSYIVQVVRKSRVSFTNQWQDLVGRESSSEKKDLTLAKKLQDKMSTMSRLYYHGEQQPIKESRASGYRVKPCFKLGVCVCGENRAVGQVCQRLSKYMMAHFPLLKEKVDGKKKFSEARTLLRDRMVVLRFQQIDPETEVQHHDRPQAVQPTDRFAHVGHINFNSWHFSVMTMFPLSEALGEVLQLSPHQPEDSELAHGIGTDTEFVQTFLNLDCECIVDVLVISRQESHWLPENMAAIPVTWFTGITPFRLWQGMDKEMRPRKRRKRETGKPLHDLRDLDAAFLSALDDMQENFDISDSAPLGEPGPVEGMNLYEETNEENGTDEDQADTNPASNATDADSPNDCSTSSASEDDLQEPDLESAAPVAMEGAQDDTSSASVAPVAQADDKRSESVEVQQEEKIEEKIEQKKVGKKTGPKDTLSTVAFHVRGGVLRFYPQHGIVTAFCDNPAHGDCRRSRTVRENEARNTAVQRGQGRPLGMLCSWLELQTEHTSQYDHVHSCTPTVSQRVAARAALLAMPGGAAFSEQAERKRREGEDSEPAKIR